MRKIILLIALLAMGISAAQAQVSFKPGIRAGANFSKITQTNSDFKTDFYVGVLGELNLGRFYTMQPEINYTRQGASNISMQYYDYQTQVNVYEKRDLTISYVSLSLINKLNLPSGFNFHIGPTIDIETDANRYSNSEVDLAFVFGFGYSVTNNLTFEARIKKGIIDVFESDYFYHNHYDDYNDYNTNLLFQIGLSYTFDLNKQ